MSDRSERSGPSMDGRPDLAEVERRITEQGLRLTRPRRAVLAVVLGSHRCLSAAQVHEAARREWPNLGLMTVYRTLEVLAGLGVVRRVHGAGRCEAFAPAFGRHGHAVVCTQCGRASEFTDCHLEAVAAAAASETGFMIADHFLQFSGLCRECRAAAGRPQAKPAAAGSSLAEAS